jgi:hypothetical protein
MRDSEHFPFQSLDFIYMPTSDVAAEIEYFVEVLGGELVFAIERFETRVAMVRLSDGSPDLLLAEHLAGERSILIFRVAELDGAMRELEGRGWEPQPIFEIPHGVCCEFHTPAGHRLAIYELTRPERAASLPGRRDF